MMPAASVWEKCLRGTFNCMYAAGELCVDLLWESIICCCACLLLGEVGSGIGRRMLMQCLQSLLWRLEVGGRLVHVCTGSACHVSAVCCVLQCSHTCICLSDAITILYVIYVPVCLRERV